MKLFLLLLAVAFANAIPDPVRWCVTSECELQKCERMVTEFRYNMGEPHWEWTCVLAQSTDQCMKWVDLGFADVVMTKGEDIYTGIRTHHLKPILYELPEIKQLGVSKHMKSWESISLAVVPKSSPISTWRDLEGKTTCHASVYEPTSFKLPVCHMIHHDIIPHKGNMMDSFVHFFEKSCVPGILKSYLNYNRTIPSTLCELCGSEDREYCHEYLDKYSGLEGASRCLTEGKGQVTFLPHHYMETFIEKFGRDYKLVCRDNTEELDSWHVKSCHMGYLPRPTLLCSHKASQEYINTLQTLLINAVKTFSSKVRTFDMFNSDEDSYVCKPHLKKDLIFQDNCRDLVRIDSEKQFASDFFQIYDTCHALKPLPTARFCVFNQESYHKCLDMQKYFMKTEKVNEISWGCVLATSQLECMKMVHNGTCDIVSTDAMHTFIGGKEFLLQPFMSQYFDVFETPIDGKKVYDHNIYTYTVGVMLKDTVRRRFGHHETYVNLKDLNTCHAGISHPSSFQYPIGWLLANGTIPRIGSIFESVDKYFKHTCLPGAKHWNMTKDLILGYEFNYGYNHTFFANFTDWYTWNVPSTWTWYTYQNVTPSFMRHFYPIEKEIEHFTHDTVLPYFKDMPVELINKLKTHVPISFHKQFIHPLTQHLKFYNFHDKETPIFTPEYIKEMLTPELMKNMITPEFLRTIFTPEILQQLDIPKHLMSMPNSDMYFEKPMPHTVVPYMLTHIFPTTILPKVMTQVLYQTILPYTTFEPTVFSQVMPLLQSHMYFQFQTYLPELLPKILIEYMPILEEQLTVEPWRSPLINILPVMTQYLTMMETPIFKSFVNRYTNPIWKQPWYETFLQRMTEHRENMCESCSGYKDHRCTETVSEPFYHYKGSMHCLKDLRGDITFLESHLIEDLLKDVEIRKRDVVLVCPSGKTIQYVNHETVKECHFGEVPMPVMMIPDHKDGIWRWKVTKALLEAQKIFSTTSQNEWGFSMFGEHSCFHHECIQLSPISMVNQTYEITMGPMLMHSLEALILPSTFEYHPYINKYTAHGQTFSNVIFQRDYTCNAVVQDLTCYGESINRTVFINRVGKKIPYNMRMCSRPTTFVRKYVEFTCETGLGYIKSVMTPTACEYVPCDETIYVPTWSVDEYWKLPEHRYEAEQWEKDMWSHHLWGNEQFWMRHELSHNWFEDIQVPETQITVSPFGTCTRLHKSYLEAFVPKYTSALTSILKQKTIIKKPFTDVCEYRWEGVYWHPEWMHMHMPMCSIHH
ncbi:TF [Branchiostoma lanceolatum]|uniref:TF protein n=1 Tax=Branchiostoma lanceolatum TaxID=7740 RepID=A0A8K0EZW2_BRALA|nr:TF [Branchiostoma lanceolatum]CAH1272767.1 TF [Branchiostoma lanceolatum]